MQMLARFFTLFCFLFSVLIFSMPYKEIIAVIQAMFLGFNLILALLRVILILAQGACKHELNWSTIYHLITSAIGNFLVLFIYLSSRVLCMIYIQLIIFRTGRVMSCFKSESFTEQVFFTVTCSCAPKRGFCFT